MRGVVFGIIACIMPVAACQAQTLGRPSKPDAPALPGTSVGKTLPANPPIVTTPPVIYQTDFAELVPPALPPKQGELPKVPAPPLGPTPTAPTSPAEPGDKAKPKSMPNEGGVILPSPTEPTTIEAPAAKADDFTPKFKFKPGDNNLLQMETANGLFKFFVGGRLQIDGTWLQTNDGVQAARDAGGIGNVRDAVNFRRARFDFGGTFYKNIDFLMEWDFINTVNVDPHFDVLPVNTPVPTDMWVTFKELPFVGNFKIGNQKPPISFEHLTSSRFLNFMERSLQFDAFIENQNNGFEPGVSIFDTALEERATWAFGVYKNTRNIMGWNVGDGEYQVTGRVTALPIYENDGEILVHVGLGASHRDLDDDVDRMRTRLMLRNGPAVLHNIVAETRTLGSSRDQVNPEFVVVWGPWTLQTEYSCVWVHDATLPLVGQPKTNYGTVQYQGAYGELLYFLTGEHQHYNKKTGAFGRTTPHQNCRNFGISEDNCGCDSAGLGAWQIGVRYSWLDLDNKGIGGSTVQDVTVGLNWFLNPYMKWQVNYSSLYRDAPGTANDGWVRGLGVRLAFDF